MEGEGCYKFHGRMLGHFAGTADDKCPLWIGLLTKGVYHRPDGLCEDKSWPLSKVDTGRSVVMPLFLGSGAQSRSFDFSLTVSGARRLANPNDGSGCHG